MSNIVREQFKVQMASFNVRDAFDEIISMYRMSADLKGINIDCDISDDVPQELIQDKLRVQQIVSNLINNSLKFSDNDTEINIRCRFFPRSSKLHIQVLDNGIGIAEKDAELIFNLTPLCHRGKNSLKWGLDLVYTLVKRCAHN